MWCGDLALTGTGPVVLQLLGAIAVVLIGLVLVLRRGRKDGAHRGSSAALGATIALLIVVGIVAVPGSMDAAQAACAPAATGNSLTIVQTSTMSGLAPNRAPAAISGLVTNNGSDDTVIAAIVVSIASVTKVPGAPAGVCDGGDFTLLAPRMNVGATLAPGGSTPFGGASIAFRDGLANQDACKGSTVNLAYTTVP